MKRLAALLCLSLFAAPDRASLSAVEKALDKRIETMFDDPFLLLGMTRGVYLEGTGVVFSSEMALVMTPGGPFVQKPSPEEAQRLKQRRMERLPVLRASMREMLVRAAGMLPGLAADERVVLGITLFRRAADDATGLPAQIVMEAPKGELVAGKKDSIRVREF